MSDESTSGPETLVCNVCGRKGFKSPRYLKSHMTLSHSEKPKRGGAKKPVKPPEPPTEPVEETTPPAEVEPLDVPEDTPPPPAFEKTPPPEIAAPQAVEPPVASEVAATPPAALPEVPVAQALDIPVGSILQLDGPTWRQNPATGVWDSVVVSKIPVQVFSKTLSSGDTMLLCRSEGSTDIWAVQLAYALSGAVTILKVAPPTPAGQAATLPEVVQEQKPAEETGTDVQAEDPKEREKFLQLAQEYLSKKEACDQAQSDLDSFSSKHLPYLLDFLVKHGLEGYLEAAGLAVQVSDDFEASFQDESGLVDWCQESGNDDLLVLKLDRVKWANFKASVAAGTAPGGAKLEGVQKLLAKMEGAPLKKLSIRKI